MAKLYIKQEGEDFKVFDGDEFVGLAKKMDYSKDKKFGYIWKLPKNSADRVWVSAGLMKDGLELGPHIDRPSGTGITVKDNYAIFDKIKDNISAEDIAILDGLKDKYIKIMKKVELERQIAVLQKMREELGL